MSELQCYGCLNKQHATTAPQEQGEQNNETIQITTAQMKLQESQLTLGSAHQVKNQTPNENTLFFKCQCCERIFCTVCCEAHIASWSNQNVGKADEFEKAEEMAASDKTANPNSGKIALKIKIICQECEQASSVKYCENCGQYLCEKCSFKIHNKGKRAKHSLDSNIVRNMLVRQVVVVSKNLGNHLKEIKEENKKISQKFQEFILQEHQASAQNSLYLFDEPTLEQLDDMDRETWNLDTFTPESLKLQDLTMLKTKYPFISTCKLLIFAMDVDFHQAIQKQSIENKNSPLNVEICEEWKKIKPQAKHQRVFSEKLDMKHNKNISNFSNLSAISKVQNQSLMSNEQSDLFQSNQLSLNVTLNQNSSILMMGGSSDVDKEQKRELKDVEKERDNKNGHHRIYSIREQNSHTSANNISSSTENSIKKRNKRWPIPYFQPFRIPKYQRGSKYNGELYLRELAEKGILMIRREKAEEFLLDPDISRHFVRNIGQKQIQYVAYIIDFLSVECLTWVIESIKQDKMTPNEKLIQSRLKESFDLKVNMKLWDSIIKYLQSPQYQQDYCDNTPVRYVPKITVVKYGEEFLLEFQERKWAYEDQELLDQEEEEWKQFKQLITDYFHDHNQITGGRYGCVQYVKLNGPKPLRKCSLGKLSLYVQQAINKGIIRYHKTLLVSNSQNHNNSFCSQVGSFDEAARWSQMQKQIKIMAIQLALIDMFLEVPPGTQISLAQIPLNLKKSIIFDFNLVELGFPKLKNILNTLSDKLILESTKTHISYEITTNGSESIEKMRKQIMDLNQKFLSQVISEINAIVIHYHTVTLEDLYAQLTIRLGFPFDQKIFQFPDFYQFLLYYCSNFATVQYVGGTLVIFSKYHSYTPIYQHQQNRSTYSQPSNNYQLYHSQQYSKTTLKKNNEKKQQKFQTKYSRQNSIEAEQLYKMQDATTTPKFNSNSYIGRGRIDSVGWGDYLEEDKSKGKEEKEDKAHDDNHSREMEHIINILDDGDVSASRPKTVIVNEETEQQHFYLLPKLDHTPDELDSFGGDGAVWGQESKTFKGKGQHTRFRSSNEVATKHSRQYSTAATNIRK